MIKRCWINPEQRPCATVGVWEITWRSPSFRFVALLPHCVIIYFEKLKARWKQNIRVRAGTYLGTISFYAEGQFYKSVSSRNGICRQMPPFWVPCLLVSRTGEVAQCVRRFVRNLCIFVLDFTDMTAVSIFSHGWYQFRKGITFISCFIEFRKAGNC